MDRVKGELKINGLKLRMRFLRECIEEQVVPRSFPKHLRNGRHPFPESARLAISETIFDLQADLDSILLSTNVLSEREALKVARKSELMNRKTKLRLAKLCDTSPWHEVGRRDLISNVSGVRLSKDELSVLSLGLKFAPGIPKKANSLEQMLLKNSRRHLSDIDQGFIQGVLTALEAQARDVGKTPVLPRRFMRVLKELGERSDLVITAPDKGGGVAILTFDDYKIKMQALLDDSATYRKVSVGNGRKEADRFNQEARKILRSSEKGKKLQYLLEEKPKIPKMRGQPKLHKPQIPMRPITSGIGSAPHRLAKVLAKPLSTMLGSISGAHLKNSQDLIDRTRNLSVRNKKLVSFDVSSLFTNVPIDEALAAVEKALTINHSIDLPIPKADYLKLIEKCVRFGAFAFEGEEYVQIHGMAMGSPLSAVLCCLFMEVLEDGPIKEAIGKHTTWLRYVDDTLVLLNRRSQAEHVMRCLNEIHPKIKFTMEEENDGIIPFLDTLIHREDNSLEFSVYRKPTNRDDFIHFFSGHDDRTKSGVIIGFYLRALRICEPKYLDDELNYIMKAFESLCYPKTMILGCLKKAEAIVRSKDRANKPDIRLSGPSVALTSNLNKMLSPIISVASSCGSRIKDLVNRKHTTTNHNEDSVVYSIPCESCNLCYIGETHRGLKTRLKEHRRDLKFSVQSNALVVHREATDHRPLLEEAKILAKCGDRASRKLKESILIASCETLNTQNSSMRISHILAKILSRTT